MRLIANNCKLCAHWEGYHEDGICSFCEEVVTKPFEVTQYYFRLEGFCGTNRLAYLEHLIKERERIDEMVRESVRYRS